MIRPTNTRTQVSILAMWRSTGSRSTPRHRNLLSYMSTSCRNMDRRGGRRCIARWYRKARHQPGQAPPRPVGPQYLCLLKTGLRPSSRPIWPAIRREVGSPHLGLATEVARERLDSLLSSDMPNDRAHVPMGHNSPVDTCKLTERGVRQLLATRNDGAVQSTNAGQGDDLR